MAEFHINDSIGLDLLDVLTPYFKKSWSNQEAVVIEQANKPNQAKARSKSGTGSPLENTGRFVVEGAGY